MVAGDEEGAVGGRQPAQRLGVQGQALDRTVDQVAGDGDRIGVERIDPGDDRIEVAALDGRPDVDIGNLHDRIALEGSGQSGNGHVHRDHFGNAARIDVADQGHAQGKQRHGNGAGAHDSRRGGVEQAQ